MGIRLALGTTPARLRAGCCGSTLLTSASAPQRAWRRRVPALSAESGPRRRRGALSAGALAIVVTALVAAAAIWTATRHVARLDISEVLRAEAAEIKSAISRGLQALPADRAH